ncbi:MAG: [LysW]-aminoadipate kinase [Chloroflexota bacterium]
MIVVKVGGSKGIDLDAFCLDLANLIKSGLEIVLVHGGSHDTNVLSEKLGKPPRFVTSLSGVESRYTDRETLEIFTMVYVGKVNKYIVEQLQRQGINAVGLSGIDGRLLEGQRKDFIKVIEDGKRKVLRDDFTGKVEKANVHLIRLLRDNGYTPVITPPAISYESEAINVDGDRAAAVLAAALGAEKLVILSNVPGLLRDVNDEGSLIPEIRRDQLERFAEFAKGRMKKKVMGAGEALRDGVGEVIFADARGANPITQALEGKGTVIR